MSVELSNPKTSFTVHAIASPSSHTSVRTSREARGRASEPSSRVASAKRASSPDNSFDLRMLALGPRLRPEIETFLESLFEFLSRFVFTRVYSLENSREIEFLGTPDFRKMFRLLFPEDPHYGLETFLRRLPTLRVVTFSGKGKKPEQLTFVARPLLEGESVNSTFEDRIRFLVHANRKGIDGDILFQMYSHVWPEDSSTGVQDFKQKLLGVGQKKKGAKDENKFKIRVQTLKPAPPGSRTRRRKRLLTPAFPQPLVPAIATPEPNLERDPMSEDLEPGDIPEYDFMQPDALLVSANWRRRTGRG